MLGCEYPLRQISDQLGPEVIFKCFSSSLFLRSLPKWMGLEYISYGSSEISANLSIQPPVVVDSSVKHFQFSSVQFSSVTQSCPTLCNPMNHSTPGLPVHHQLLEFTQTHIRQVGNAIQPSHPLLSPFPPASNPSQH